MTNANQPHHSQDRSSVSRLLALLWRRTKDDRYHTMSERTYAYFIALIGVVCGWVVIRRSFSPDSLTLRNALVQGFFVGYGQSWCGQTRDETKRLRATVDPHSPEKYRTNGVVSNMPEFQEAFHCKAEAPMVNKNRCRVW